MLLLYETYSNGEELPSDDKYGGQKLTAVFIIKFQPNFSARLWSEIEYLAFGPHAVPASCGQKLDILLLDPMPFRRPVVRSRISCLWTARHPGVLWSEVGYLAFGPHATAPACGQKWDILPLDPTPPRQPVVRSRISCFWTPCRPGGLWSEVSYLAFGPHAAPMHCGQK